MPLSSLHVLNRDVNMIQTNISGYIEKKDYMSYITVFHDTLDLTSLDQSLEPANQELANQS